MAAFLDFSAVKESVSIEQAVAKLGLAVRKNAHKLRGACPACKSGGDRAIAIDLNLNKYFCFAEQKGGDQIALVAHIRGIGQREAAEFLGGNCTNTTVPQRDRTPSPVGKKPPFDPDLYAKSLNAEAEQLQVLGISPQTFLAFRAGYSSGGVNRGRLALPITDAAGNITGYVGRALTDEQQPTLLIPNGVEAEGTIFGREKVGAGELFLVRDVLDVLRAHEGGISAVCVLTEGLSALQLQVLATLLDEAKIERLEF